MSRQRFSGWGRTNPTFASVATPTTEDEVLELLATGPVIPRGLGRSYGDPAQVSGGIVARNEGLGGIGPISSTGVVTVGAGVSIDELLAISLPQGWFVPVTPGTRQVSLGGAIAADVHGKNHHRDGSIGDHVLEMRIVTPIGAFTISPTVVPNLFWATIGGMGLTGVITSVTLRMLRVTTDQVLVDTDRLANLDEVMAAMASGDDDYRYSVAWVDCMTKGRHMGRAILTRGDHAEVSDAENPQLRPLSGAKLTIPFDAPSGLLNPLSIRIFNELWYRVAPKHRENEAQALGTFFHPLDGVNDWNRLYGRRGFVQYQFAVSDDHADVVVRAIERLSSSGVPSFLAVLKRFGPGNHSPLSFPMAGWTLALDLPVGPSALSAVLDDLDELVLNAGGRVYLAKDARVRPDALAAMYPRLEEFLAVKRHYDPEQRLVSDLSRRLNLGGN